MAAEMTPMTVDDEPSGPLLLGSEAALRDLNSVRNVSLGAAQAATTNAHNKGPGTAAQKALLFSAESMAFSARSKDRNVKHILEKMRRAQDHRHPTSLDQIVMPDRKQSAARRTRLQGQAFKREMASRFGLSSEDEFTSQGWLRAQGVALISRLVAENPLLTLDGSRSTSQISESRQRSERLEKHWAAALPIGQTFLLQDGTAWQLEIPFEDTALEDIQFVNTLDPERTIPVNLKTISDYRANDNVSGIQTFGWLLTGDRSVRTNSDLSIAAGEILRGDRPINPISREYFMLTYMHKDSKGLGREGEFRVAPLSALDYSSYTVNKQNFIQAGPGSAGYDMNMDIEDSVRRIAFLVKEHRALNAQDFDKVMDGPQEPGLDAFLTRDDMRRSLFGKVEQITSKRVEDMSGAEAKDTLMALVDMVAASRHGVPLLNS